MTDCTLKAVRHNILLGKTNFYMAGYHYAVDSIGYVYRRWEDALNIEHGEWEIVAHWIWRRGRFINLV